jgi:hypothetical protein
MKNLLKLELSEDGTILSLLKVGPRLELLNLDRFIGQDFTLFINKFFHHAIVTDSGFQGFNEDSHEMSFFTADKFDLKSISQRYFEFNLIGNFSNYTEVKEFIELYSRAFVYQPGANVFINLYGDVLWKNNSFNQNPVFENNLSDDSFHQLKRKVEFKRNCFDAWVKKKPQFHTEDINNISFQFQITPVYYSDNELIGFRIEPILFSGVKSADLSTFPMSNPNPVVQLDLDLRVLFANSAAKRVLISDNDLLEKVKLEIFNLMKKNAENQSRFSHQINLDNLNYRVDFTRNKDSWNLYFIDASEVSRINNMHSVSQSQLEAIINSSRNAIILLNQKKQVTYFNKRARTDTKRYFGMDLYEGSGLEELLEGGFSKTFDVSVQTVLKSAIKLIST